jgi:hypothetical protein
LEFFQQHFPSRADLIAMLMVCAFPTHVWAYIVFLYEFPAYLMRLDAMDILGILSYAQVHAFMESLLILVLLVLVAVVLPRNWFRQYFLLQGTILVLASAIWVIPIHFWLWKMRLQNVLTNSSLSNLTNLWHLWLPLFTWLFIFLIVIIVLLRKLRQPGKLDLMLRSFVDRLTVLSTIYLLVDVIFIAVVVVRNLI